MKKMTVRNFLIFLRMRCDNYILKILENLQKINEISIGYRFIETVKLIRFSTFQSTVKSKLPKYVTHFTKH